MYSEQANEELIPWGCPGLCLIRRRLGRPRQHVDQPAQDADRPAFSSSSSSYCLLGDCHILHPLSRNYCISLDLHIFIEPIIFILFFTSSEASEVDTLIARCLTWTKNQKQIASEEMQNNVITLQFSNLFSLMEQKTKHKHLFSSLNCDYQPTSCFVTLPTSKRHKIEFFSPLFFFSVKPFNKIFALN